jgi:hypothetical protein
MLQKLLTLSLAIFAVNAKRLEFSRTLKELGLEDITVDNGFNIDINFDVLKNAGNVWFDELIQVLNGLEIPDYEKDKNAYMKDNHFYIESRVDDVIMTPDPVNNSVSLVCNRLTALFVCDDFKYKLAPFVVAEGDVEVAMNEVRIGFGLKFETQIVNGRQLMAVETVDIIIDIDK